MRPRRLRLPALALLLGAATSIAIACALSDMGIGSTVEKSWTSPSGIKYSARIWHGPNRNACNLWFRCPEGVTTPPSAAELREAYFDVLPHSAWHSMVLNSAPQTTGRAFWNLQAYGWPMRCMAGGFLNPQNSHPSYNLGWYEASWLKGRGPLPLRPIWEGLALDAAAFGAPWWALLMLPGFFRRRFRRRRGRCPRCAYDLLGNFAQGCPECGWGREPSPTHT